MQLSPISYKPTWWQIASLPILLPVAAFAAVAVFCLPFTGVNPISILVTDGLFLASMLGHVWIHEQLHRWGYLRAGIPNHALSIHYKWRLKVVLTGGYCASTKPLTKRQALIGTAAPLPLCALFLLAAISLTLFFPTNLIAGVIALCCIIHFMIGWNDIAWLLKIWRSPDQAKFLDYGTHFDIIIQ